MVPHWNDAPSQNISICNMIIQSPCTFNPADRYSDRHCQRHHSAKGDRARIMPNIPGKVKCPQCGSEDVRSKLSLTNIVAWAGKLLGVPTVKIYEKRCAEWGKEFQIFRKWEASMMAEWRALCIMTKIFSLATGPGNPNRCSQALH